MKGLHIDPERRLAWAQAGLTAGEYTAAAGAHGLATPFGDTGSVGISGLTLGGGIGWLVRKYGLAIDALVSVEIVTADGRLITASEEEHTDLFWAVRGGGGNFGVVTRFQFRLYPGRHDLRRRAVHAADEARSCAASARSRPARREGLTTISMLMAAPPAPFIPAELHGKPTLAIMFVFDGDAEAGQAAIEPFRQVATPMAELVMPMPYPGIYELLEDAENPGRSAHRSLFLDTLDDAAIDAILEHTAAASSPATMTQIRILGGAMARVPAGATAFAHRDAGVMVIDHDAVRGRRRGARSTRRSPRPTTRRSARARSASTQLPRGRGRGAHPRGLPRADLPPAGAGQARLRPDQPVPPQPEHPARGQPS